MDVEIIADIDCRDPETVPFQPQLVQRTNKGWHWTWRVRIDRPPEWLEHEAPRAAAARLAVWHLLRDCLAAAVRGYDRAAPLQPTEHGEWEVNAQCPQPFIELSHVLSFYISVPRQRRNGVAPVVVEKMAELGYTPGARFTRDKCWRDDHVSGGHGKGTCVVVDADGGGVACYGQHTRRGGGSAYISAAALVGAKDDADPLWQWFRNWCGRVPDVQEAANAITAAGLHMVPLGFAAACQLTWWLSQPVAPRPAQQATDTSHLLWDTDVDRLCLFEPHRLSLHWYAASDKHILQRLNNECPGTMSAQLVKSGKIEELQWVRDRDKCEAVLNGDPANLSATGLMPARLMSVPPAGGNPWTLEAGRPVRCLHPPLPGRAPDLKDLLSRIPIPGGMSQSNANALRALWCLPALTTSLCGQLPLVFLSGPSGCGKTLTALAIQRYWRYHVSQLMVGDFDNKELYNMFLDARRGGIFLFDETGGSGAAVSPDTLNLLKSLMTVDKVRVRLYYGQTYAEVPIGHVWLATGQTLTAVENVENDWFRRLVPIEFPDKLDAEYPRELLKYSTTHDCMELCRAVHEAGLADIIAATRNDGPVMRGWAVAIALAALCDMPIRHDELMNIVAVDSSAVDALVHWWSRIADRTRWPLAEPHRIRLSAVWREILVNNQMSFRSSNEFGNVLRRQCKGTAQIVFNGTLEVVRRSNVIWIEWDPQPKVPTQITLDTPTRERIHGSQTEDNSQSEDEGSGDWFQ